MKRFVLLFVLNASYAFSADDVVKPDATKDKKASNKEDSEVVLQSTFVGDKEQPAVSYFVPWRGSASPDKLQWNTEPKNDQALEIVDRDVMVNSMNIYNDMNLEKKVSVE